jgi:hypothetical protein
MMTDGSELWNKPYKVNRLVLDRLQFSLSYYLSQELQKEMAISPQVLAEMIGEQIVYKIRFFLYGKKIKTTVHYPRDWWEAFKDRWFPQWLKRKYPVQYQVIQLTSIYPKIAGEGPRIIVEYMEFNDK